MSQILNATWAPTNATSADLWGQRSLLGGLMIASSAYGITFTLFILCFNLLISKRQKTLTHWLNLIYVCIIFALATIGNAMNDRWCEMAFIDNINFPGGPIAFNTVESANVYNVVGTSVYIVNLFFQDGLLLYRFFIIWNSNRYISFLPALTFLATLILGSLLIAQISDPTFNVYEGFANHLAITFWSLSIAYNTVLTLAITAKLLYTRWMIRTTLSSHGISTPYVSVSAMLIESAALYTINGLVFIVSFGVNSPIQNLVSEVLGQSQSIAQLLIVYRVLQGRAWSSETSKGIETSASIFFGGSSQPMTGTTVTTTATESKVEQGDSTMVFKRPDHCFAFEIPHRSEQDTSEE